MSEGFIQQSRDEEKLYLLRHHPNAFLLLTLIADRARRYAGGPDGLLPGQCYIGDYESCGLTEQKYRTAKELLKVRKHILICETCRTRQKSTTGATTIGTLVKLISTNVYDINLVPCNDRLNDRATTDQRPGNDELIKEEYKERKKEQDNARSEAKPPPSKDFFFDHQKGDWEGITIEDMKSWKEIYAHMNIPIELKRMIEWVKSNPSKGRKKKWRSFVTRWLEKGNEHAENKKAYLSQRGSNKPESVFGSENLKEYSGKW